MSFWVQRVSQEAYGALKGFWDVLLSVGFLGLGVWGLRASVSDWKVSRRAWQAFEVPKP